MWTTMAEAQSGTESGDAQGFELCRDTLYILFSLRALFVLHSFIDCIRDIWVCTRDGSDLRESDESGVTRCLAYPVPSLLGFEVWHPAHGPALVGCMVEQLVQDPGRGPGLRCGSFARDKVVD